MHEHSRRPVHGRKTAVARDRPSDARRRGEMARAKGTVVKPLGGGALSLTGNAHAGEGTRGTAATLLSCAARRGGEWSEEAELDRGSHAAMHGHGAAARLGKRRRQRHRLEPGEEGRRLEPRVSAGGGRCWF